MRKEKDVIKRGYSLKAQSMSESEALTAPPPPIENGEKKTNDDAYDNNGFFSGDL